MWIEVPVDEMIVMADDLKSRLLKRALHAWERRLVSMIARDRVGRPIDNDQASPRVKRLIHPLQDHIRMGEFVEGVTDQHGIHRVGRQTRIVFIAKNDVDGVLAA